MRSLVCYLAIILLTISCNSYQSKSIPVNKNIFEAAIGHFVKQSFYKKDRIYSVAEIDSLKDHVEILIETTKAVKLYASIKVGEKPDQYFPTSKIEQNGAVFLVHDDKVLDKKFYQYLNNNIPIDSSFYRVEKGIYPEDSIGVYGLKHQEIEKVIYICRENYNIYSFFDITDSEDKSAKFNCK